MGKTQIDKTVSEIPIKFRVSLQITLKTYILSTSTNKDKKENLYSNKLENLEKMDRFQDACELYKLNQEEVNYLNRSITNDEVETIMVSQQRKVWD
jgi:prolyl oligopeptidase PreP (S9A serine peptidase family)